VSGEVMPKGDMTLLRRYIVVERYKMDNGYAYECGDDELDTLLHEMGELEPIVDAINERAGFSIEQRAAYIGCEKEDFHCDVDCDSEINE